MDTKGMLLIEMECPDSVDTEGQILRWILKSIDCDCEMNSWLGFGLHPDEHPSDRDALIINKLG